MAILLYGCNNNKNTGHLDNRIIRGTHKKITFYDTKSNKKITSIDINNDSTFSINFIHSVNKTNITDYYSFDNKNNIILNKTNYKSFGAGVPTEINDNETFKIENNGSYTIENINKNLGTITLYLSDIYEHILKINEDKEYHLWSLIGKKEIIEIKIEN